MWAFGAAVVFQFEQTKRSLHHVLQQLLHNAGWIIS